MFIFFLFESMFLVPMVCYFLFKSDDIDKHFLFMLASLHGKEPIVVLSRSFFYSYVLLAKVYIFYMLCIPRKYI